MSYTTIVRSWVLSTDGVLLREGTFPDPEGFPIMDLWCLTFNKGSLLAGIGAGNCGLGSLSMFRLSCFLGLLEKATDGDPSLETSLIDAWKRGDLKIGTLWPPVEVEGFNIDGWGAIALLKNPVGGWGEAAALIPNRGAVGGTLTLTKGLLWGGEETVIRVVGIEKVKVVGTRGFFPSSFDPCIFYCVPERKKNIYF